jgi:hypothetical protein
MVELAVSEPKLPRPPQAMPQPCWNTAAADARIADSSLLLQRENDFHRMVIEFAANAALQLRCAIVWESIDVPTSRRIAELIGID